MRGTSDQRVAIWVGNPFRMLLRVFNTTHNPRESIMMPFTNPKHVFGVIIVARIHHTEKISLTVKSHVISITDTFSINISFRFQRGLVVFKQQIFSIYRESDNFCGKRVVTRVWISSAVVLNFSVVGPSTGVYVNILFVRTNFQGIPSVVKRSCICTVLNGIKNFYQLRVCFIQVITYHSTFRPFAVIYRDVSTEKQGVT